MEQDAYQRGHSDHYDFGTDYNNLGAEKGRADTDIRQIFNLAAVWQLDYYHGTSAFAKRVLNGWQISPIVKLRSGLPLTIFNGVDANLDGNATDRAQLIGDSVLAHPSAAEWFNTTAFAKNPIVDGHPVDGNSGRTYWTLLDCAMWTSRWLGPSSSAKG